MARRFAWRHYWLQVRDTGSWPLTNAPARLAPLLQSPTVRLPALLERRAWPGDGSVTTVQDRVALSVHIPATGVNDRHNQKHDSALCDSICNLQLMVSSVDDNPAVQAQHLDS